MNTPKSNETAPKPDNWQWHEGLGAEYPVTPTDALPAACGEVSLHRAQEISRQWAGNPADPATKFYIQRHLWQFLYAEFPPEVAGVQGTLI